MKRCQATSGDVANPPGSPGTYSRRAALSVHSDIAAEAAKAAPPVAVASAMIAGMTINDWVTVLTGLYVLLQIFVFLALPPRPSWQLNPPS